MSRGSVDNQLRQKLSRCLNVNLDYKERYQTLKKAYGGIQDPNMKQTLSTKAALVAHDGIEVLLAVLRIEDTSIPKLPYGFDIWDAKGPEWRYKYLFQNYAALSLRRLCEIGTRETSSGLVRLDKIVTSGAIETLVPHLYLLECAAAYAAGILKEISCYEIYRPLIIQAHALYPLCLLLNAPIEIAKTSIRQSAECLRLLSCTCADQMLHYSSPIPPSSSSSSTVLSSITPRNDPNPNLFNNEKLILSCFHHIERTVSSPSTSTSSPITASLLTSPSLPSNTLISVTEKTDQDLLNTILCFANLTAGYEDLNPNKTSLVNMEIVYQKMNLGQHLCRALYASFTNSSPYLMMRWNYLDILSSILLLVGSTIGKKQVQNMAIKSENSNLRMKFLDLLTACLKRASETKNFDELKIILEIFLHLTFEKDFKEILKNSKLILIILKNISELIPTQLFESSLMREEGDESDEEEEEESERVCSEKNHNISSRDTLGERKIEILSSRSRANGSSFHLHPMLPCVMLANNILFVVSGNMNTTARERAETRTPTNPNKGISTLGTPSSRGKSQPTPRAPIVSRQSTPKASTRTMKKAESRPVSRSSSIQPSSIESENLNQLLQAEKATEDCEGSQANLDQKEASDSIESKDTPNSTQTSPTSRPVSAALSPPHLPPPYVMISYCWANQPLVFELCHQLKALGVSYWLDVEKMYGNINDRMAEAIESCAAVMVCLSSKYKLSANCRMEAEYSTTQRKRIIPMMVEEKYQPDGWLGLIISGKLWYDITEVSKIPQILTTAVMTELQPVLEEDLEYRKKNPPLAAIAAPSGGGEQNQQTPRGGDESLPQGGPDNVVPLDLSLTGAGGGALDPFGSSSMAIDLMRELMSGMERRLQACLESQVQRVEDHLKRLEKRLDSIEAAMVTSTPSQIS
jgi:hypothetical protein